MELSEYRERFTAGESSPGWDAIDQAVKPLYPGQEPRHLAATPHYSLGGNDPIDGISFYAAEHDGQHYTHVVSYGFSSLYYDEESAGGEFSRFGFELTFRVAPFEGDRDGPIWAANLIQNIARYVFSKNTWFEPNHYMDGGGPIRLGTDTDLTALAFIEDPELGSIDTVHGRVQFLQIVGLTTGEFERARSGIGVPKLLEPLREHNPLLITDLSRVGC